MNGYEGTANIGAIDRPRSIRESAGEPTLTDGAARVASAAGEVRALASRISGRLWPEPELAKEERLPPQPDALPSLLAQAEKALTVAIEILGRVHSKL